MSAVNETIVREFFEVHGFLVRQLSKHVGREEEEVDFLVINPRPIAGEPLPFELAVGDVPRIQRAIVTVRGWHTESFGPGLLANAPELFRFVEPDILKEVQKSLGEGPAATRLVVIPSLTQSRDARGETIDRLRAGGIDAVITFRTLLASLIDRVEVNRNYAKSDLLQLLRILKNYELVREPQMDLFRGARPSRKRRDPESPVPPSSIG